MTNSLVTGANGQLGRRVVELLKELGEAPIEGTRNPRGAQRQVDFAKPGTLEKAFAGVERLLLISTDAVGSRIEQQTAAVAAAKRAGVKHIVYTSLPMTANKVKVIFDEHAQTEKAIEQAGIEHTFLRNNLYIDLSVPAFQHARSSKVLRNAIGSGLVAYVTREDCARAAAAALHAPKGNRAIDITGPRAVSQEEIAKALGAKYQAISVAEAVDDLVKATGMPKAVAEIYVSFQEAAAAGQLANATKAVQELTGRAPASVEEFVARTVK